MLVFYKYLVSSTCPTVHIKPDNWFYKTNYEYYLVQGDFSKILSEGESITSGAVICYDNTGASTSLIVGLDEIVDGNKIQFTVAGGALSLSPYRIYCRAIVSKTGDPDSAFEIFIKMNIIDEPVAGEEVLFGGEAVLFGGEPVTFGEA